MSGAIFVLKSENGKTGDVAATYASIAATCSRGCALRDEGCYAQTGRTALTEMRTSKRVTPEQAAREEGRLIQQAATLHAANCRPLRLHVSGDCRTTRAAKILGKACRSWPGAVWTYTHAWRNVRREAWGPSVSILASVETLLQAQAVRARGYAPALVVAEHPKDGKAWVAPNGIRFIPCPEQTRGVECVECRLCFDADALRERNAGIAFAAHGGRMNAVKRRLAVLQ